MSEVRATDRKVFVTGATGLLGTHFLRHLNRAGVVPRVLLRREIPEEAWDGLRVEHLRSSKDDPIVGRTPAGAHLGTQQLLLRLGLGHLPGHFDQLVHGRPAPGGIVIGQRAASG